MDGTAAMLWLAVAVGVAVLGGLLWALLRGGQGGAALRLAAQQAELAGRLGQIADGAAAAQAQVFERLAAQERQLAKLLDERLAAVTLRVGESLLKQSAQTTETMTDLRTRLAVIDQAQKNITQLSEQVVSLQNVLSNRQARGAFGEVQLRDLVQAALPPSAYRFQAQLGDGRRVDCLLLLPNPPGPIAIDAKFPLENYHALRRAEGEAEQTRTRRLFAADVLRHVKDIAEKYIVAGETAESALMFLPSEAVYAELHANFAEVIDQSYRARVWIVSPTTLMATLNTVRAVLKDARMREQAGVIQTEVRRLLEDVTRLDDRVGKLQRHFDQATDDIRQIRVSTDKIGGRAERIEEIELGGEAGEAAALPEDDAGPALAPPAGGGGDDRG